MPDNYTATDEKPQILAWLSPLEPQRRHQDIRARRADEVGEWLLQTEEYRSWFDGIPGDESSALFCYGDPGVGKTYISSLVIDTLYNRAVEENSAVACFYFDFAAQEEESAAAILGSVLKQIVGGLERVPERIVKAFRDRGKVSGRQRLALAEIVESLQDIASSRRTFICIDALDQCPLEHRVRLLDSLNRILQKSPGARIFLTGRPDIRDEVDKHLAGRAAIRSITPPKNDIVIFLREKLREDMMPDAMDESLKEEIIRNIPETFSEIFLLASLGIETILQEVTIQRRIQKLRIIQNGLDLKGAYGAALGRIKAQGGEKARLGVAVLMWITHSRRPLRTDEICYAIATQIGSNGLNDDDIPAISTLLSCCQGLATIEKGTSTIRLIHSTLQEYLRALPGPFGGADSTMAEICLTYLNFQHIKDLSADPSPDTRSIPFLEYSSLYWGTHMRKDLSDRAKTLALALLNQFESHISAKTLWNSISWEFTTGHTPDLKPFSALHCISYFGIAEVANTLIRTNRWDVNETDGAGMTPLMWAARYGHEEVVRLLVREKHIRPDQENTGNGRTALSWAAEHGHEGVVRLFLGPQFVNRGSIRRRWGKALRAAGLLFGRRHINPGSSSKSGRTPLSWAAENGHEGVVRLLLARKDSNPDASDTEYGRTPLSWAAANGHEGIVKLLSGREDVRLDSSSISGRTSLSWAAGNGHEGIVKLLLARKDVNPSSPSASGKTPLSWAAENGHERVVALLLERNDVNPDDPSKSGRTPLWLAAENGHEGVVKLLLGRRDVRPGLADTWYGQTPLSRAAQNGHEGVVRLLLERQDVNPDTPDVEFGRTPLSWAAENGHKGIVELLLERSDVAATSSSKSGLTPLALASANGHESVVGLLQARFTRRTW